MLRAVGHQDNLQVHHEEDFPRILVTTMFPTYTSARVSSTEEGVALRASFTRSPVAGTCRHLRVGRGPIGSSLLS